LQNIEQTFFKVRLLLWEEGDDQWVGRYDVTAYTTPMKRRHLVSNSANMAQYIFRVHALMLQGRKHLRTRK
jgi:hypothetical protein